MRKRFLLVFNPTAGIAGRRLVERVTAALESRGASVVPAGSHKGGPDLSILDREPFDAVIAAGGDGTIRALARDLGTRLPIGVLPMGTGNVLACEISLPRSPRGLADTLMAGPVREIEGARANGEPFFLMAGAGLDGEIIARLSHSVKQRVGKAAYAMPVLGALSHRQGILECDVDGQRHEAGWIVVAKSRCYGGSFVIAPDAGVLKPGLVAVLFKSDSRIVRVRQLLALATGALARDPSVTMIPCTRVDVASARPQRVEIDGDEFGATPLKIVAGGPRAALILPSRTP